MSKTTIYADPYVRILCPTQTFDGRPYEVREEAASILLALQEFGQTLRLDIEKMQRGQVSQEQFETDVESLVEDITAWAATLSQEEDNDESE